MTHVFQLFKYNVEDLKFVKSIKTIITSVFIVYLYAVFILRRNIMTSEYFMCP
jgi:hypothetical protein